MRNVIRQSTMLLGWRIVLSALCGVCLLVMSTVSQAQSALDWSVTISSGMPPPPRLALRTHASCPAGTPMGTGILGLEWRGLCVGTRSLDYCSRGL